MKRYMKINKADVTLLQLAFKRKDTELLNSQNSQDLSYKQLLEEININDKNVKHKLEEDINYQIVFTSY